MISGRDENNLGMLFNTEGFSRKIDIEAQVDEDEMFSSDDVYYKLMVSDVTSEIINIASGRVHSLYQIIEVFKAKTNHDINIQINPNFVRKDEVKSLMGSNANFS